MIIRRRLLCAALLLSVSLPLAAPARAIDSGALFETELERLSEILGALHYLRPLCGAKEDQKWRNEMRALLEAEAQAQDRKVKLMASFNRGYNGFRQTYRSCTPAADLAVRRYLDEGAKIAREITARYTN
ncbi:TIGR02301 family protein [Pseudorhodoplanes sp.]|uniref:TIGR02301 family protein n=1 Tax=Pseudorhodoplanes sp. TaxID=1934341 RepID=UPI00391BC445